jgi:hypothetical protein
VVPDLPYLAPLAVEERGEVAARFARRVRGTLGKAGFAETRRYALPSPREQSVWQGEGRRKRTAAAQLPIQFFKQQTQLRDLAACYFSREV